MMKALSLSQPFAWSIFDPIADKGIENRSWPPPVAMVGQVIAIHAAKSWIEERRYTCAAHGRACDGELFSPIGYFLHLGITNAPAGYDAGAIIGVATIDSVITDEIQLAERGLELHRRWFFGPFGWVLANRRRLPIPIPATGKQGLWRVPEVVEREIWDQLKENN